MRFTVEESDDGRVHSPVKFRTCDGPLRVIRRQGNRSEHPGENGRNRGERRNPHHF
jgi:hypothetical protein